jgi:3-hydroxyacyl-CoA dehydrogenase/enoyl-CoA hydratase/3-hydroxybutyryl-CoA epimerase
VGPVALLDEVGLDVAHKAAKVMHDAFGERLSPPPAISKMLADDRQGRKNGRGFYAYSEGHKTGVDERVYRLLGIKPLEGFDPADVERRLLHIMLNEAAMACGEGAVRSPRDGDVGAIFGIGFPPFRGGPLRLIDDTSATRVVDTLRQLATAHGPRFTPAPALEELAERGARYYPTS